MEPVTPPPRGYVLNDRRTVEDVLAVEAELLRSEGLDPEWPGFGDDRAPDDRRHDSL